LQKGSLFLLERAFEIGFRLKCWRDLVPHGKWLKWLEQHVPQISERTISRYIRLWDNNEWLKSKLLNQPPLADLSEIPTIREAEALIQAKESNKPRGPKRKVGSLPKSKEKQASLQPVRNIQTETVPFHSDETPEPAIKLDESDSLDGEESGEGEEKILASELLPPVGRNGSSLSPIREETVEVRLSQLCPDCRKAILAAWREEASA
jgi:hypothetical protein